MSIKLRSILLPTLQTIKEGEAVQLGSLLDGPLQSRVSSVPPAPRPGAQVMLRPLSMRGIATPLLAASLRLQVTWLVESCQGGGPPPVITVDR